MRTPALGGAAGLVFVAAALAGLLVTDVPDESSTTAGALRFYAEDGNRAQALAGGYLLGLAALAFAPFAGTLVRTLRGVDRDSSAASTAVVLTGAYVALQLTAAAAFLAPAATLVLDPEHSGRMSPAFADFARGLSMVGDWLLLVAAMLAAAGLVATLSIGALRSGALPRWIAWSGVAVSLALLFGALFVPVFLFLLWALAVSVWLLRPRRSA